jgi:hypothetical protein
LSRLAETIHLPSGEKATSMTRPLCPFRVCSSLPDSVSQTWTVLSLLPDATSLPSGEKAALLNVSSPLSTFLRDTATARLER